MKSINFLLLFLIFFICSYIKHVESQEQRQRKGSYVGGRNNMPTYGDRSMTRTEKVKVEEREQYQMTQEKIDKGTTYKDYLFTVEGVEEFIINLPVTQQVAISIHCYAIYDGTYITQKNIENEPPVKIFVYENNNRLIHQSDFYFQNFIIFEGQELSTYTIRFMNSGSEKMITMSLKKLTENSHVEDLVDKNIAESHALKAKTLMQEIKVLFNSFERYNVINFQLIKTLLKEISFYFYWNVIETIFTILVCAVQIISIGKICKTEPIV